MFLVTASALFCRHMLPFSPAFRNSPHTHFARILMSTRSLGKNDWTNEPRLLSSCLLPLKNKHPNREQQKYKTANLETMLHEKQTNLKNKAHRQIMGLFNLLSQASLLLFSGPLQAWLSFGFPLASNIYTKKTGKQNNSRPPDSGLGSGGESGDSENVSSYRLLSKVSSLSDCHISGFRDCCFSISKGKRGSQPITGIDQLATAACTLGQHGLRYWGL